MYKKNNFAPFLLIYTSTWLFFPPYPVFYWGWLFGWGTCRDPQGTIVGKSC